MSTAGRRWAALTTLVAYATTVYPSAAIWSVAEMTLRPGLTVTGCEERAGGRCVLRCALNPYGRRLGPQESVVWSRLTADGRTEAVRDADWQAATTPATLGKATVRSERDPSGRHFSELTVPNLTVDDAGLYACDFYPGELGDKVYLRVVRDVAVESDEDDAADDDAADEESEGAGDGDPDDRPSSAEATVTAWTDVTPPDGPSEGPETRVISPIVRTGLVVAAVAATAATAVGMWVLWRLRRPSLPAYRRLETKGGPR